MKTTEDTKDAEGKMEKPDNLKTKTYRQQFEEALACTTKEEAEAWLRREVEIYRVQFKHNAVHAESVIRENLGYMAGYYSHETAQKIHQLFGATHPIFGTADYHETMTPKQLVEAGKAHGEAILSELKAKS